MSPALAKIWGRQDAAYWEAVTKRALELKTDGCSGPAQLTQWYKIACYEHDIHYRDGKTICGDPISREDADKLFAHRIRQLAWDGLGWDPRTWRHVGGFVLAALRWAAVRIAGQNSYKGEAPEPEPQPRETGEAP